MEAFSTMVTDHQKLIYKVCHMYADVPEDVEDLFQDIVLNLWRAFPMFDGRAALSTWLYKVALNTAITQFRKVKRRQAHEVGFDIAKIPAVDDRDVMDRQLLYMAIKRLNKVEKALVILYLEDHSYKEMSDIMGISENYVGVQLNRIKQKLRDWTRGDEDGSR